MRLLEKQACLAESVSISTAILADVMKDVLSHSCNAILMEENTQRSSKRMDKDIYKVVPCTNKKTNIE